MLQQQFNNCSFRLVALCCIVHLVLVLTLETELIIDLVLQANVEEKRKDCGRLPQRRLSQSASLRLGFQGIQQQ